LTHVVPNARRQSGGPHRAHDDAVDPDPVGRIIRCHRTGQPMQPRLGGRVGGEAPVPLHADDRGDGGDIDDSPPPCAFMGGILYLQHNIIPLTLTCIAVSHVSSVTVSTVPGTKMPTLLRRMSSLPYCCTTVSTSWWTSAAFETSAAYTAQVPPSCSMV